MSVRGARQQRRQKLKVFCKSEELIHFEKRVIIESLFFHSKGGMREYGITFLFQVSLWHTLFDISHITMLKPRVLLISSQHLFGESMEMILRAEKDIELVGPWNLGDQDICRGLLDVKPSAVVIADENLQSETAAELTKSIIEHYPEISVIRTSLNENIFRIFSARTLPARGDNLLETIRTCITPTQESAGFDRPQK